MSYAVIYDDAGNVISCSSGDILIDAAAKYIASVDFVSPDEFMVDIGPPAMIVPRPVMPPSLDTLRHQKTAAITARAQMLLDAGAPYSVTTAYHIALDDGSRSDLTAMAATASAALTGAVPWPESYSRGWITVENVRIPLATPADGLTLAASVGNYYAAIVQHRRDLKNTALAAADETALAAIDETAGWPV